MSKKGTQLKSLRLYDRRVTILELIESHPIIWKYAKGGNMTSADYSRMRADAWVEIRDEFISISREVIQVSELKETWRNLRDYYMKRPSHELERKWKYYQTMSFMEETKKRRQEGTEVDNDLSMPVQNGKTTVEERSRSLFSEQPEVKPSVLSEADDDSLDASTLMVQGHCKKRKTTHDDIDLTESGHSSVSSPSPILPMQLVTPVTTRILQPAPSAAESLQKRARIDTFTLHVADSLKELVDIDRNAVNRTIVQIERIINELRADLYERNELM